MKKVIVFLYILMLAMKVDAQNSFKTYQIGFDRVKTAYELKWNMLSNELKQFKAGNSFQLLMIAYKQENKLELWLKSRDEKQFRLFKTYDFCKFSGTLGPKVMEGDLQTPEGFYTINVFNPLSSFHLSLGVDYPNQVDLARTGKDRKPGGDIYIHGACETVGCIPLTDDKIREVYVLAVEAKNAGQENIPVYIFPFKMEDDNMQKYAKSFPQNLTFWQNLKKGYDYFNQHKRLLQISQQNGQYLIK
ncbi:L,D-transpeptidase family protein [Pedobacter montanisoli]|uniref:L,D-transpeptidase family protein n=1 Tax=Pedobacter montanisoli TaxID=2923277 RepID=A0ABS9ZWK2_9SPHI|nr:L,D-transpeptidase family protein [Pedobacter montanisoli]MCJ0742682.1 L,D-transpeptidase family protein [Pedobacter montanisoli]